MAVVDVREFIAAVEQVAAGSIVLDPAVVTQLPGHRRNGSATDLYHEVSTSCWPGGRRP